MWLEDVGGKKKPDVVNVRLSLWHTGEKCIDKVSADGAEISSTDNEDKGNDHPDHE